ncbi:MAG: hypothetical protein K9W42_13620 [Candidatus Heimdallarchaeota archaeon]|nr:hypothetical protein [Candidatus Heimdallarchaeota archaeon]
MLTRRDYKRISIAYSIVFFVLGVLYFNRIPLASYLQTSVLKLHVEKIYLNGTIMRIFSKFIIYGSLFYEPAYNNMLLLFEIIGNVLMILFSFSVIFINCQEAYKKGNWKNARKAARWRILFMVGRALFAFGALLSLIGLLYFAQFIVKCPTTPAQLNFSYYFFGILTLANLIGGIIGCRQLILQKKVFTNEHFETIRQIAHLIVNDKEFIENKKQLEEFKTQLTEEDVPYLFFMAVDEKALAGGYTNDFETIAKAITAFHPKNISFYYELIKEYMRQEKRELAEEIVEAIDLIL